MPINADFKRLPAVFTSADFMELQVPRRQIDAWRESGVIESLGRGLFMKAGTRGDPDLLEISKRAPGATICLVSALVRHDLSDQIPSATHIALGRSQRQPRTLAPVAWHRFQEETFDIGRSESKEGGGCVLGLYDPMRSIVDAFRLAHLEGRDVAIEALRRWLRKRGSQPAELLEIAAHFPAAVKPIRVALGVLL